MTDTTTQNSLRENPSYTRIPIWMTTQQIGENQTESKKMKRKSISNVFSKKNKEVNIVNNRNDLILPDISSKTEIIDNKKKKKSKSTSVDVLRMKIELQTMNKKIVDLEQKINSLNETKSGNDQVDKNYHNHDINLCYYLFCCGYI
jgi:IMP dehydrogenase/GMP reductase